MKSDLSIFLIIVGLVGGGFILFLNRTPVNPEDQAIIANNEAYLKKMDRDIQRGKNMAKSVELKQFLENFENRTLSVSDLEAQIKKFIASELFGPHQTSNLFSSVSGMRSCNVDYMKVLLRFPLKPHPKAWVTGETDKPECTEFLRQLKLEK